MAKFLYEFRLIGDWFRQFLYDISESFLDRDWIIYEDHYENIWFGIIYTLIALAILPFAVDLLFTFILSFRSRKLIFFHTIVFKGFKPNDFKIFNSSSDLKRFSLSRSSVPKLANNRVITVSGNRVFVSSVAEARNRFIGDVNIRSSSSDVKIRSISSISVSDVKLKSNSDSVRFNGLKNTSSSSSVSYDLKNKNVNSKLSSRFTIPFSRFSNSHNFKILQRIGKR